MISARSGEVLFLGTTSEEISRFDPCIREKVTLAEQVQGVLSNGCSVLVRKAKIRYCQTASFIGVLHVSLEQQQPQVRQRRYCEEANQSGQLPSRRPDDRPSYNKGLIASSNRRSDCQSFRHRRASQKQKSSRTLPDPNDVQRASPCSIVSHQDRIGHRAQFTV